MLPPGAVPSHGPGAAAAVASPRGRAAAASGDAAIRRRLTSVGRPLPSLEVEIRDTAGRPLPPGERGEIHVRGEQVSGEYLGRGSTVDEQGWFPTRDGGWLDDEGYPAIKPPWGTLNAVDLNTGRIKWKVALGEYPELTARGIPPTGTENYGGPLVTAGGLIFIGATADETFRVFDKETGDILWKAKLPFGGNASPSTYMVNGRQYVVISAGGGKGGRPRGGTLVAFALPH